VVKVGVKSHIFKNGGSTVLVKSNLTLLKLTFRRPSKVRMLGGRGTMVGLNVPRRSKVRSIYCKIQRNGRLGWNAVTCSYPVVAC
jgi:hypothetical protein